MYGHWEYKWGKLFGCGIPANPSLPIFLRVRDDLPKIL